MSTDHRAYKVRSENGKFYQDRIDLGLFDDGKPLSIPIPNITGIYLSIADTAYSQARDIYKKKVITDYKELTQDIELRSGAKDVFDCIEQLFIATIFYYTAIEAFVNRNIPNDKSFQIEKNNVSVNKTGIEIKESHVSTSDKIKYILPQAYQYSFDYDKLGFWSRFKELEDLRNEIIHSKEDLRYLDKKKDNATFFVSFLFIKIFNHRILESAREVLEYLSSKTGDQLHNPRNL